MTQLAAPNSQLPPWQLYCRHITTLDNSVRRDQSEQLSAWTLEDGSSWWQTLAGVYCSVGQKACGITQHLLHGVPNQIERWCIVQIRTSQSIKYFITRVVFVPNSQAAHFDVKMWLLRPRITIVLLTLTCLAASLPSSTWCLEGIITAVQEFTFAGQNPADYYGNLCRSNLSTVSFWANAKVYCTASEIVAGQEALQSDCVEYGHTNAVTYNDVASMLTDDFISSLPVVTYSEIDPTKAWNTPIMLDRTLEAVGVRTIVSITCLPLRSDTDYSRLCLSNHITMRRAMGMKMRCYPDTVANT